MMPMTLTTMRLVEEGAGVLNGIDVRVGAGNVTMELGRFVGDKVTLTVATSIGSVGVKIAPCLINSLVPG